MGVVNLAWYRAREALEQSFWDDCYPINAGWPETFTVWQIAKLQTDNEKERSAIENKLIADFEGLDRISAPAVRQWMKGNAITPSVHIAAWFDSVIVETPTAAPVTPDNSGKPESTAERYARWLKWHDEELEKFDSVGALERVLKREEERCHPKKPPDRSTIGKAIAKLRKELSEQKRSAQVFGIR